ncbi:MAG: hypothetical protein BGO49_20920 [Planctomycetales bacterium 71-10]|nr:MAG: hypothetical protein BGO49_20920 [Planctomycetales bacterium 71-10]
MRLAARGLLAACIVVTTGLATAGPARYDAESRSMRFTYTYASLTPGAFGDAAIGAPQQPSKEQDATVRAVVLKVSDSLAKATGGRLRISALDLVPDARRADVVISLTGDPGRGGWAIAGAIEGRPGQIGLYYQVLAKEWEQDYVLTAAHEVCHYVFGLVDEYNFPQGCPLANPGGPGCLMDNYLSQGSRHGWYGRFCQEDHVEDASQRASCQKIVDKFFSDRKVTSGAEDGQPQDKAQAVAVVAMQQSKQDNIVSAAVGKIREEAEAKAAAKANGSALKEIGPLRSLAQKFLEQQFRDHGLSMERRELGPVVEKVLRQAGSIVSVAVPPQLRPVEALIARFASTQALKLKDESPKEGDDSLKRRLARDVLSFLSGLGGTVGSAPVVGRSPDPEIRRYLEDVAAQAIAGVVEKRADQDLYEAALQHIKLDRESAGTILDIATEIGVPGTESRLEALNSIDTGLNRYLPGRTASTGFGRRRTVIVDPDPLDPRYDFIFTQAGMFRYSDVRDQYVELFSKLIQRAQVQVFVTEAQKRRAQERRDLMALPAPQRAEKERLRRISELKDRDRARNQREAELRATINELATAVARNQIENVVVLAPPGGIPAELITLFESFRRQIIRKGDVRIDLVLVSTADVPRELRDIAVGSGGSIITIADVDEVGAVAQRLKNDQTSGSWLILPYQDRIDGPGYREDRRETPWLLDDPRRGEFKESPIDEPFARVRGAIEAMSGFFSGRSDDVKAAASLLETKVRKPCDSPAACLGLLEEVEDARREGPEAFEASLKEAVGLLAEPPGEFRHAIGLLEAARLANGPLDAGAIFEAVTKAEAEDAIGRLRAAEAPRAVGAVALLEQGPPGAGLKAVADWLRKVREKGASGEKPADLPGAVRVLRAAQGAPNEELKKALARLDSADAEKKGRVVDLAGPIALLGAATKLDGETAAAIGLLDAAVSYAGAAGVADLVGAEILSRGDAQDVASSMSQVLDPARGEDPDAAQAEQGLKQEVETLHDLVGRYNRMTMKGGAEDLRYKLLEHVIRARGALDRAAFILNAALESHRPFLNRDYKEDQLYSTSYDKDRDLGKPARPYHELNAEIVEKLKAQRSAFAARGEKGTVAYLGLKIQEVRLRLVQNFVHHLEDELERSSTLEMTPIFHRVNREAHVRAYQMIEDKIRMVAGPDGQPRHLLPPVDVVDAQGNERRAEGRFRLPHFYADNVKFDPKKPNAEFEIIIGFTRPLPGVDDDAIRDPKDLRGVLPELKLYNFDGRLQQTPTLELDRDLSTPTCLIYHFAPEFGENGWYTAGLILKESTFRGVGSDRINFTFSVASTRPNVRLTAALVPLGTEDADLVPPPPRRGLARAMDRRALVEVQVYGGTSILGARVVGTLQKIDAGSGTIEPIAQDFYDDGRTYGDRQADDGVYTSTVSFDRIATGAEYRIIMQAESTKDSRNIPPEDPARNDEARRKDARERGDATLRAKSTEEPKTIEEAPSIKFQRATSVQLRVDP